VSLDRSLESLVRRDRALTVAGLAVLTLLAWLYLVRLHGEMAAMADMGMAMEAWSAHDALVAAVMWAVMMVAMMLPSTAPVTLLVANIARQRAAKGGAFGAGTALFVLGYLAVWVGFAAVATTLQWGLDEAGLMSDTMGLANQVGAGIVLMGAGIYQWTPLKETCLRHCRSPLDFLLFHWREGRLGAFLSGLGHGAFCLGCCWMLMALLFVGGIMNLAWIAAIALLVLIEKTLPWGGWTGRLAGILLVLWGAVTLAMAA
jgi:predicted metal-binding membrane protein